MRLDVKKAAILIAKEDFYAYCRLRLPSVFTKNRPHLIILCNQLQKFIESKNRRLILNCPPRHGKTVAVELLTEWYLGKNPTNGVIIACYNELLSSRFSKQVRGGIQEKSTEGGRLVFSDFFPGVNIQSGDGAMQVWALEGSHFSFLATSPGGTTTGIGAQLVIIDDLIKNAEEANNARVLDEHFLWYNNTMLSRIEARGKQIIIQTRWSGKDLSGRLLDSEPDKWELIKMQAQNEDGSMLCEDILAKEEYEYRKTKTDPVIIAGNYQQEPYDEIDRLYIDFKTYTLDQIPEKWERIEGYVDTADGGGDSFAGSIYGISKGKAYILDILFTSEGMEQTEIKLSRMINAINPNNVWIESNNGGAGFARNIEKKIRESGNRESTIRWFHQSGNKEARILTQSFSVQNCILFPTNWRDRWPNFAKELESMGRAEKWRHDDAADCLTGIIEKSLSKSIFFI